MSVAGETERIGSEGRTDVPPNYSADITDSMYVANWRSSDYDARLDLARRIVRRRLGITTDADSRTSG